MITQVLTPFDSTKQAIEGTANFRANASYSWSWLIEHSNQQNTLIEQFNNEVAAINQKHSEITQIKQDVTTAAQNVSQDTQTTVTKASEASQSASSANTSKNAAKASEDNAKLSEQNALAYKNAINPDILLKVTDTIDLLTSTLTNKPLSANQGRILKGYIDSINTLLSSDDSNLDTLQEIVAYIKANKNNLDALADIHSKTAKTTLADADEFMTADSTSSWSLKKITWASIKTLLTSLFIPRVTTPTTNALAKIQADGTIKNSSIVEDANGNIGVGGITPSAWAGCYPVQLGNSSGIYGFSNSNTLGISANSTWNGTNDIYRYSGNAASKYSQSSGVHTWQTAPSGTAGNAIPWINAMTLDTSGTLTVGNSSLNRSMPIGQSPLSEGTVLFNLYQPVGQNITLYIANGGSANTAATTLILPKNSSTNRSINAAGTINASGADYAEYEYSNGITLVKGQIVGFKANGTLTDKYSEAIRFAIKSTNPSIVGGDVWGCENVVGIRPEKPVRKLDITKQKLIKDAVLGDDGTILEDAVYETVIIEKDDSDKEWELIYSTYEKDLADFEARLETERQKVDRIAYAGKVPVNVYEAKAGQYIIASNKDDLIVGIAVDSPTFEQYLKCVGRVNKILDDGRAEVAVIIH